MELFLHYLTTINMVNKESISHRLNNKLEMAGLSVPELAQLIDIDQERLYKWKQGPHIPKDPIEFLRLIDFLDCDLELVPRDTLNRITMIPKGSYKVGTDIGKHFEVREIPLIDATAAMAGKTEYSADMTPITAATGSIDVGDLLRDSKIAMRVYGNSMIPGYPPGCVIGLIEKLDLLIHPGHCYVIETLSDRYLKRLFYSKDKLCLEAYSDNIAIFEAGPKKSEYMYPPFDIPKRDIKRLYDVTGVIKRNKNTLISN